eukprot:SAG22_NODE_7737_length_713_cov_0.680782_2_plen_23_part_01
MAEKLRMAKHKEQLCIVFANSKF